MSIAAVTLMRRELPLVGRLGQGLPTTGAAILLWALWPILAVGALAVPPFLLLAIACASGFLVSAVRHRLHGRPVGDLLAVPLDAAGLLGIVGSQACGLLALRLAFPADAAVASAPWPVLGAAFGSLIGQLPAGVSLGGLLAAGAGLCWLVAGRVRRGRTAGGTDPLGGLCAIAAPLCLLLHLCLEPRLPLDGASLLAAAAIGLGPLGLAGALRDRAAGAGGRELRGGPLSAARRRGAADR